MAPIPTRRLTLLDSMILIVALAAVLPATRQVLEKAVGPWSLPPGGYMIWRNGLAWHNIRAISLGLSPTLASLTIALTALQWRRPRLTFRMLGRGPGLAACGVATVVLVVEAILGLEFEGVESLAGFPIWWLPFGMRNVGGAVLGAWIALALSGRWRRRWRRDGLDKLGRVLGVWWSISYLLMLLED